MLQRLWMTTLAVTILALGTALPASAEFSVVEQHELEASYRAQGLIVDFDADRGLPDRILNARLGLTDGARVTGTPEEISAAFLREHAQLLFGTEDVLIDALGRGTAEFELVTTGTRESLSGTQVFRQQFSRGLPIDKAIVQVNLDHNGQVMSAVSKAQPRAVLQTIDPIASRADAVAALLANVENPGTARVAPKTELVGWYNGGVTHLTWKVEVALWSPYSDQFAYVDAISGKVLSQHDEMINCSNKLPGAPIGRVDIAPPPAEPEPANAGTTFHKADGSGNVLPANPLNDQPSRYGLRDGDPVVGFVENKTLPRLDGSGFLRGDYVDATNSSITRANEASLIFNFSPDVADGNFHEANVYWHLDTIQDYFQTTLGITNANNRRTTAAAHEGEDDNSSYSPGTLGIRYGDGGVDDSEDGEVILHEYGHAVHDNISGIGGGEAGAISEGFGDYLAASFGQNPLVAEWDATSYNPGPPPNLRRTDGNLTYPDDLTGEVHADGEIISAAWWELNTLLGRETADKLTIESFFLVGASTNMPEMADAYVQADQAIYGGAHIGTIFAVFGGRGMGPSYLLEINHTALADTENTAGPYAVNATVLHTSPITGTDAVQMHWRVDGDPGYNDVTMVSGGGDLWVSSIPGPGGDATIEYYITVEDDLAVTSSAPLTAPGTVFSFNVGTDFIAPMLTHTPLGDQPLLTWPAQVRATVTDNLGVASVVCDYSLNSVPQGSFPLFVAGGDNWAADFPISSGSLVFGDIIEYSITATDGSSAANQVSTGPHSFEIIDAKGVVLIIDDDDSAKDGGSRMTSDKVETFDVPRDPAKIGSSATQMAAALTATGYVVTVEPSSTTDPGTWGTYNLIISSSGASESALADAAYRAALVAYTQGGGKLLVEGGEVGYRSVSSPGFPEIVSDVIHAFDWNSDNAGPLAGVSSQSSHPIRTYPNAIPTSIPISYSGYGDEDAVTPNPEAYTVYGTTNLPNDAGVLVYDDNVAPASAQIVYCAFSMSSITDPAVADALTENIVEFLLAEETGATASVSGQITLENAGAASGITVLLNGDPVVTDGSGNYEFTDLFAATYSLEIQGPAGYESITTMVAVSNGQILTNLDFILRELVETDITCNEAITPIPDNTPAGITSEIYVGDSAEISTVTVSVDITHTWQGDLIVDLTSPEGTTVRLHNRTGGSADNLIETYAGLVNFAGEASIGTWSLTVSDNAGQDTGQLNEWCINMEALAFGAVPVLVSNFDARNVEAGVELSWNLLSRSGVENIQIRRHAGDATQIITAEPLKAEAGAASFIDRSPALEDGTQVSYVLMGTFSDGRTEPLSEEVTLTYARVLPQRFALNQNFPNPFNPSTSIQFALPVGGRTSLKIYDLAGRLVKQLVSEDLAAGTHSVRWDGRDDHGRTVASGTYLYRLQSNDNQDTRRMLLLK